MTAPIAKPTAASFIVKSALCRRMLASAGWFTCAGWPKALRIVQTCGIEVSSATNGHVHPAELQIQRYSSQRPTRTSTTRATAPARPAARRSGAEETARRGAGLATAASGTGSSYHAPSARRTGCRIARDAARSVAHRRRAEGASRAHRGRERSPARRLDRHLGDGARAGFATRSPIPARRRRSTRRATSGSRFAGASDRALLIGGHIDSVPNGGWLDGCLNVIAGVEVLRRIAAEGTPPLTVRLVNWADEEGARFGRSLFGSSAAAGSMADQDELRQRTDANGIALPDALARARRRPRPRARRAPQLESAAAYLELHIEQGPVLESLDLPLGVVLGTFGVERHQITWTGQAAHAGSTPMDKRRDALAGAAKLALEIRPIAARGRRRGRLHVGRRRVQAGDRHLRRRDGRAAARPAASRCARSSRACWTLAKEASERFAHEEDIEVAWEPDLEHRADPVRRAAGRARRRSDPRGERDVAPTAERPAARRRRGRARGRPDRHGVRAVAARPLAHEARGHEGGASGAVGPGTRSTDLEDDGGIRMSDDNLFGDEHVRRYVETDGEVGYIWREGAPILILTVDGPEEREGVLDTAHLRSRRRELRARRLAGRRTRASGLVPNLVANPEVGVQVKADRFRARARTAEGEEHERLWAAMNEIWPHYDEYQAKTDRADSRRRARAHRNRRVDGVTDRNARGRRRRCGRHRDGLEHRRARRGRDAAVARVRRRARDHRSLRTVQFVVHMVMQIPGGRAADRFGARNSALRRACARLDRQRGRASGAEPALGFARARDRRPRYGLRIRRRQRLHPREWRIAVRTGRVRRRLGARARASRSRSCRCSPTGSASGRPISAGSPSPRSAPSCSCSRRRRREPCGMPASGSTPASSAIPALPLLRDSRGVVRLQRDRRELGRDAARAPRLLEGLRGRDRLADALARLLHAGRGRPAAATARRIALGRREPRSRGSRRDRARAARCRSPGLVAAAAVVGLASGVPFAMAFTGAAAARPDSPGAAVGFVNGWAALAIVVGSAARRPHVLAARRRSARLRRARRPRGGRVARDAAAGGLSLRLRDMLAVTDREGQCSASGSPFCRIRRISAGSS